MARIEKVLTTAAMVGALLTAVGGGAALAQGAPPGSSSWQTAQGAPPGSSSWQAASADSATRAVAMKDNATPVA